jgi:adenosine deaminase
MLDAGLRDTINSDDPAYMFGKYMTESMVEAQADSKLTAAELVLISRNTYEAAWVTDAERAVFIGKLDAYAKSWGIAV